MISQTVEYALRAVGFLASEPSLAHTTKQIAKAAQVPQAYLSKVMQQLAAAGLVHAQRGTGGGFTLLKRAHELNILEVIEAVDRLKRSRSGPIDSIHKRLDDVLTEVEVAFAKITFADIMGETKQIVSLRV